MVRTIGNLIGLLLLATLAIDAGVPTDPATLRLTDVDGRPTQLFRGGSDRPVVLVFLSSDCPVSNRYAPELRRLFNRFRSQGVRFWLVYPNPTDEGDAIRAHLSAYSLPIPALRDPGHVAARFAGVRVTPEAALFDAKGRLLYRGRIDDRFPAVGVERRVATRHDLEEAIAAALAGTSPPVPTTEAVGCYLSDMAP